MTSRDSRAVKWVITAGYSERRLLAMPSDTSDVSAVMAVGIATNEFPLKPMQTNNTLNSKLTHND